MTLGVSSINANISAVQNGIVSGAELQQVSQEIFESASKKTSLNPFEGKTDIDVSKAKSYDNGLSVFGVNANSDVSKFVSLTKSGLNTPEATKSLDANVKFLNAQAAVLYFGETQRQVDGKMYVPADNTDVSKIKENTLLGTMLGIVESKETNKDKRGSNPFIPIVQGEEPDETEEKSLNIFM